ncbi:minor capsid protein [Nonomuraea sp. NPDC050328]|uniref:minor capsid protein n=1 Tax=Nonomuraea sp. NPDC050328 TaxID=3364361 RepID=UPI003790D3E4
MSWTTDLLAAFSVRLAAAGVGVWHPDGSPYGAAEIAIVHWALPSAPDRALALATYGVDQLADDPVNTDGTLGLQVRMRGAREDPGSVNDIADHVFDVLQGLEAPADGVLLCTRRMQAAMGVDSLHRWERADSYHLLIHQPSSNRPG